MDKFERRARLFILEKELAKQKLNESLDKLRKVNTLAITTLLVAKYKEKQK